MTQGWPAVSYDRWAATCDTLHAYTQVLGKLAVELAPPEPQLQHAALRLTARGWETAPLPARDGSGSLVVALDLRSHEALVEHSDGRAGRVSLTPDRPVADVTREVLATVGLLGGEVRINPAPQEVPWDVPLDEDYEHARYDPAQVRDYFAAATQAALALAAFRAPYRGRSTPVNAWWGSFDLAVSLFSGTTAEPPETGFIMRNAGDAEQFDGRLVARRRPAPWRGLLRLRLPEAARLRGRRPVPGRRALGPECRRVHPGLGRRTGRPGPARGGAGVHPLRVPALLRDVPMEPQPARQHRGQPASRQMTGNWSRHPGVTEVLPGSSSMITKNNLPIRTIFFRDHGTMPLSLLTIRALTWGFTSGGDGAPHQRSNVSVLVGAPRIARPPFKINLS